MCVGLSVCVYIDCPRSHSNANIPTLLDGSVACLGFGPAVRRPPSCKHVAAIDKPTGRLTAGRGAREGDLYQGLVAGY